MQEAVELALGPERTNEIFDGKQVPKDTPFTFGTGLDPERRYEFADGQPVEKEMPGARHSGVSTRLARKLGNFVEAHSLGEIYQEASFQIGTHERIPDLASSQRLALVSEQLLPGGRCPLREIFNQPRGLTT